MVPAQDNSRDKPQCHGGQEDGDSSHQRGFLLVPPGVFGNSNPARAKGKRSHQGRQTQRKHKGPHKGEKIINQKVFHDHENKNVSPYY